MSAVELSEPANSKHTAGPTCKVSVIVPAYKPGAGIRRVIDSLARQTMPSDEFELIIVDDGSPDDTWDQLREIRSRHDNIRIERIENSGWPSRPRNIGLDLARGEYVLFMDHDDEIYPDGLKAAYEYAAEHSADVLNPKENKTSDPRWGLKTHTADLPNALPERGIDALMPMMPHKLYRRQFLLDHDIRFPEGRRMLWEDVYFNVECYKHAKVVSMLSSTAVYLWHATHQNNSSTYGPASDEFWDRLDDLFAFIDSTLDDETLAAGRRKQLRHQYHVRVIQRLTNYIGSGKQPERVDHAVDRALAIVERYIPEDWDAKLPPLMQPYAWLLRRRRVDQLRELISLDRKFTGATTATTYWWSEGRLHVLTNTQWTTHDGHPLTFRAVGDRILRDLPETLDDLPDALRDVTHVVQRANVILVLRDETSKTSWNLPTQSSIAFEPVVVDDGGPRKEGIVTIAVSASTTIEPSTAAQGKQLRSATWVLTARQSLLGKVSSRPVRIGDCDQQAALLQECPVVVHPGHKGALELEIGRSRSSFVSAARPDWDDATISTSGTGFLRHTTIDVPLLGLHADHHTTFEGELRLERRPDARKLRSRLLARAVALRGSDAGTVRIVTDNAGARLHATFHRPVRGAWRIRPVLNGRPASCTWDLP